MKVTELVAEIARPIAEAQGCSLWDVEYIREGGDWYLRVYIDREDGVDIADCEAVSRAMDPILDEKDPIPESYSFEVCSAGLGRALKKPEHFMRSIGEKVELKLYRPKDGTKEYAGTLTAYEDGIITVTNETENKQFNQSEVAQVRLAFDF